MKIRLAERNQFAHDQVLRHELADTVINNKEKNQEPAGLWKARAPAHIPTHLLIEPLNPALEVIELLLGEISAVVERAVEVLGEHVLVEALAGEAARGIAAGEVLVGPAGSVEVAPGRHVVHLAAHRKVYRLIVRPVVRQQRPRRERPEHDRRGPARQRRCYAGLQPEVDEHHQRAQQDQVQRCCGCEAVVWFVLVLFDGHIDMVMDMDMGLEGWQRQRGGRALLQRLPHDAVALLDVYAECQCGFSRFWFALFLIGLLQCPFGELL